MGYVNWKNDEDNNASSGSENESKSDSRDEA